MRPIIIGFWRLKKTDLFLFVLLLIGISLYLLSVLEDRSQEELMTLAPVLKDRVIVIDPGHGGVDPGAVGKKGTLEKDINLEVAKRLGYVLSQSGARVVLTREIDTDLSDPEIKGLRAKKRQDLKRRVELAEKHQAEIYLSIHVNSFPSASSKGPQTFYHKGQEESKAIAERIQAELQKHLNTKRVAKGLDGIYINKKTEMPSVTVEIGFMSNAEEEEAMQEPDYQNKIAWSVFAGLVRYFAENEPKETTSPNINPLEAEPVSP